MQKIIHWHHPGFWCFLTYCNHSLTCTLWKWCCRASLKEKLSNNSHLMQKIIHWHHPGFRCFLTYRNHSLTCTLWKWCCRASLCNMLLFVVESDTESLFMSITFCGWTVSGHHAKCALNKTFRASPELFRIRKNGHKALQISAIFPFLMVSLCLCHFVVMLLLANILFFQCQIFVQHRGR